MEAATVLAIRPALRLYLQAYDGCSIGYPPQRPQRAVHGDRVTVVDCPLSFDDGRSSYHEFLRIKSSLNRHSANLPGWARDFSKSES